MQPYNNSPKFFHWQNNERDLLGMLYSSLNRHHWSACESIISRMLPFLVAFRFMSFETFMSIHKIWKINEHLRVKFVVNYFPCHEDSSPRVVFR